MIISYKNTGVITNWDFQENVQNFVNERAERYEIRAYFTALHLRTKKKNSFYTVETVVSVWRVCADAGELFYV